MRSVRAGREVDSALRKKGFLRFVDSDHIVYRFFDQSGLRVLARTKISHGMMGSTLNADLISKMASQLRLTKAQFLDFIDCSVSEEEYRKIIEKNLSQ